MLLAGEPCLPALLLAVGPGFQAVLLGSSQMRAHILVSVEHQVLQQALNKTAGLFNPETCILIQKRHAYTANLNSETSGDSKDAFLHCGDVLGCAAVSCMIAATFAACCTSGVAAYFSTKKRI